MSMLVGNPIPCIPFMQGLHLPLSGEGDFIIKEGRKPLLNTHKTLANPYPRTPAMAAGISNRIWTIDEIVKLAE